MVGLQPYMLAKSWAELRGTSPSWLNMSRSRVDNPCSWAAAVRAPALTALRLAVFLGDRRFPPVRSCRCGICVTGSRDGCALCKLVEVSSEVRIGVARGMTGFAGHPSRASPSSARTAWPSTGASVAVLAVTGGASTPGATGSGSGAGGVSRASTGAGLGLSEDMGHRGAASRGDTAKRFDLLGAYSVINSCGSIVLGLPPLRWEIFWPEMSVAAVTFQISCWPSRSNTAFMTRFRVVVTAGFSTDPAL